MRCVIVLGGALALSACVSTRDPQVVPVTQAGDAGMTCEDIVTEYRANTETAAAKIKKNSADDVRDVALGVLIWPGMADFKNADGTEGNNLLDRNVRLRNTAVAKGCDPSGLPAQPRRYD